MGCMLLQVLTHHGTGGSNYPERVGTHSNIDLGSIRGREALVISRSSLSECVQRKQVLRDRDKSLHCNSG